jgi:hypothetical protein
MFSVSFKRHVLVAVVLAVAISMVAVSCGDSTGSSSGSATTVGPTTTVNENVSLIQTRGEIESLIAEYFWAFDTFDTESFVKLFASDGELILTGVGLPPEGLSFQGPDKLREFLTMIQERTLSAPYDAADVKFSPNLHFISNLVLEVNGDTATGKSYWYTVRRGENHDLVTEYNPSPSFFASIGFYEEEYVKQDGKWLFKKVVVREFSPAVTPVTTTTVK